MILHMNDKAKTAELMELFNAKRNELIQAKIQSNTNNLMLSKKHESEKQLKRFFLQQNEKAVIQNLYYNDEYLPADTAMFKYYKQLMNKQIEQRSSLAKKVNNDIMGLDSHPVFIQHTEKDVKKAIKQTNPSGASGYDKITQRMLRSQRSILYLLFNCWSKYAHIPKIVKTGTITSIPKMENATTPDKFRPIALLPIIYKV